MPRRSLRVPSYRRHKPSGQAVVTLSGKDFYLGPHGTEASKAEYDRLVGQWQANGRRAPTAGGGDLTISELILAYWRHAEAYYVKEGEPTSQLKLVRRALRGVRQLYGPRPVSEFGPLALKAVRQAMIAEGLSRGVINAHVGRIRLMFRWGVEQELIPESIHSALSAVRGLAKGRTEAKDHPPVQPAPEAHVWAAQEKLRPALRAMIELQWLTAMRPGEVAIMRAEDIEATGAVWVYVPGRHKTEHHDKSRRVYLGPRAQAVLGPWLERFPTGYLFHPSGWNCEAIARKTARRVGEFYSECTYWLAIRNACDKAGVPRWHPNQLRHAALTRIRREHGLEAAQVIAGHSKADVTQVYAERDMDRARDVMAKVG